MTQPEVSWHGATGAVPWGALVPEALEDDDPQGLERGRKNTPSVCTLQRYATAVRCGIKIELVPMAG